jgi:putative ABC transport system permease protein
MITTLEDHPGTTRSSSNGGAPARRAVVRWAWRLFRREWRQQLLILALVIVATAATILGSAVATNSPQPKNFGFGNAQNRASFQASATKGARGLSQAQVARDVASLQRHSPRSEVIDNETLTIPGSIDTYELRAESPHGALLRPMLSLVSGHYPTGSHQVALTASLASAFNLHIGDSWQVAGVTRLVVGIVDNPQSLLDEFALVPPGQVKAASEVTVLFNGRSPSPKSSISQYIENVNSQPSNGFNPETISIAGLVLGMMLIALVSIGGFTVLAQRRLRSIGMLQSLGATDQHVGLVVRANGAIVGAVGAIIGTILGLASWLAYRPSLIQSAHHEIGVFALPWLVVILAVILAIAATYFAASRPARALTKIPIVSALAGRPAPPRQLHRTAVPGIVFFVIGFLLLGYAGGGNAQNARLPELAFGLILLFPGIILLAPFCLTALANVCRRGPLAIRLSLRDLSRYRARSGSALSAISVGILIAVIISLVSAARFANVLDYAGPNMTSSQLNVYTANGPYGPSGPGSGGTSAVPSSKVGALQKSTDAIAGSLGSHRVLTLETTSASLNHNGPGRSWSGPIFVATPQLLKFFGIASSEVEPDADVLTMRPGLSGVSHMQLTYGDQEKVPPGSSGPCTPATDCLVNPVIQEISALPSGTSVPNTVITEHAVREFHLHPIVGGWMIQAPSALSAEQISSARLSAASAGMSVESKNSLPSSSEIIDWATFFGMLLALCILAMSVGLIRSETAGDLRILAATGASRWTRRALTATTAGALGLLGAVLGTVAAYIGVAGWIRTNSLNGGLGALGAVPVKNLLLLLVGMPLLASLGGWIFSGRQPALISRQPLE